MQSSPVVLKFGGSSVAEVKHWDTIVLRLQIELQNHKKPILVLSALKDVSNSLEQILHQAKIGQHQEFVTRLVDRHIQFARQLNLSIDHQILIWGSKLLEFCEQIKLQQLISPSLHAQVLAIGELMSTTIGAAYINKRGILASWVDARELLLSNDQPDQWHHYTSATCSFDYQPTFLADFLKSHQPQGALVGGAPQVIVTQGFIAADSSGQSVLLGREGSDTSAAYIAAKTRASQLQIWTDVAGVYSANPAEIPNAVPINRLTYKEAHIMAKMGAKVLHPKVIRPLLSHQIPLIVKSTWHPDRPGTQITESATTAEGALAVVVARNVTVINPVSDDAATISRILKTLLELGFDLLLLAEGPNLVLNYNNTDKPRPANAVLAQKLELSESCILPLGALISVVGTASSSDWQSVVIKTVDELSQTMALKTSLLKHLEDSANCISIYLSNNKPSDLAGPLHDRLFKS